MIVQGMVQGLQCQLLRLGLAGALTCPLSAMWLYLVEVH